jgi:hypothetical protein
MQRLPGALEFFYLSLRVGLHVKRKTALRGSSDLGRIGRPLCQTRTALLLLSLSVRVRVLHVTEIDKELDFVGGVSDPAP